MESVFKSLLPSNSTKAMRAAEHVMWECWRDYYTEREALFKYEHLLNYKKYNDDTPDVLFDAFSISVGVEVWDSEGWTKSQKARIIGRTRAIKRARGLVHSFYHNFESLDMNVRIVEWWQDDYLHYVDDDSDEKKRKAYDFKIIVSTKDNDITRIEKGRYHLKRIVEELAPIRCSYDLYIESSVQAEVGIACAGRVTKVVEINTTWEI